MTAHQAPERPHGFLSFIHAHALQTVHLRPGQGRLGSVIGLIGLMGLMGLTRGRMPPGPRRSTPTLQTRPRSNRSRFITFTHAATKSSTNFFCPSELA